jgi:hypothetical protein
MLQLRTVNRALAARGIALELVKGEGYFYVAGPGAERLRESMIYAYRLNQLTLDQWFEYVEGFAAQIAAERDRLRSVYDEHAAEARACGFEVETFAEWLGEVDPREAAELRVARDWELGE